MKYIIAICIILPSLNLLGQNNFSSTNLPIVVINTNNQTISAELKITANMRIIYYGLGIVYDEFAF